MSEVKARALLARMEKAKRNERGHWCDARAAVDAACDALPGIVRALAAQWRPIETAPKDGTWVMLGIVGRNEVLLAYWHRLLGEWWGQSGSSGEWKKWQKATHWQPMPEAPHADD